MSIAEYKFEVLSELSCVEQINNLHEELMSVGKTAIEKAVEIGHLLIEIKRKVGHRNWLSWCAANLKFTDRTARNYVKLAQNQGKLENISNMSEAFKRLIKSSRKEKRAAVDELTPEQRETILRMIDNFFGLLKAESGDKVGAAIDFVIEELKAAKRSVTKISQDQEPKC